MILLRWSFSPPQQFFPTNIFSPLHLFRCVLTSLLEGLSVRRSVRPSRVFFNEPIVGEIGRKWRGKRCKCSLSLPNCPKMFKSVPKCPLQTHYCPNRLVSPLHLFSPLQHFFLDTASAWTRIGCLSPNMPVRGQKEIWFKYINLARHRKTKVSLTLF